MANNQREYDWDSYADEAKVPDFVLKRDGEEVLRVANPTGVQVLRISQGFRRGDIDLMLQAMTGDAYDQAMNLLSQVGHKAFSRLVEDMMEHFGLYDEVELVGPSGGTVRETKPTKIMQLLKMGYVPKGEARASRS